MIKITTPRFGLIGKFVSVDGFRGKIIDETKNMLTVEGDQHSIRRFIKRDHRFVVEMGNKKITVKGEDINRRPEDRIRL